MADWDEIKRLAAEFQRVQASDTSQRLSERNIHDLIKLVVDKGLIELIYTKDGKAIITPDQLRKEIEDEVYVNGGRMTLHDLGNNLNVDYNLIDRVARELVRERPDEYSSIPGQLIHSSYRNTIGKIVQSAMLVSGQLSIPDFSKNLDLPPEYLLRTVKKILPSLLDDYVVSQDESTFYTTEMIDRYKSIISGTLSAILKPTSIASIMKKVNIPERIFTPIVDGLIKEGRVDAIVDNRQYVPSVYARQQNEWISEFYSKNLYIDYDILTRMDIKQPKVLLRKRFPEGIALDSCFISPHLLSQVESLVEETIATDGWIDISSIISTAIEEDDINQLLQLLFKKNKQLSGSCSIFNRVNVCSHGYIENCKKGLRKAMQSKAQEHLKEGVLIQHFFGGKLKEKKKETSKENEQPPPEPAKESEQTDNSQQTSTPAPQESESVEKLPEREKSDKRVKIEDSDESDNDQKGKKSRSRKSGGGAQGREIKQKSVKKKYIPGNKGNQRQTNDSDDESVPTKTPRSNKGRAARRAISPERPSTIKVSTQRVDTPKKEPLIFMNANQIAQKLQIESGGDGSDELFESIADLIEEELNANYQTVAKETLDEYLKSKSDDAEEVVS